MSFVIDWLIPIIKAMFGLMFVGFFGYGCYIGLRKALPQELNAWMKFKILKKPYPEDDVAWCVDSWEKGASVVDVKKYLRINGVIDPRLEETVFIFREITKLKGGQKFDGRQIKTSPLKTFG